MNKKKLVRKKINKRRKGINGRNKGSTFERKIAKHLSDWCGYECRRTPMSGGWSKQSGDITPKHPEDMIRFKFNIECKNQNILKVQTLFTFPKSTLIKKWWKQCSSEAKANKKYPLLVFTRPQIPIFVMTEIKYIKQIWNNHKSNITFLLRDGNFGIILWEDLLKIPYKDVVQCMKKGKMK